MGRNDGQIRVTNVASVKLFLGTDNRITNYSIREPIFDPLKPPGLALSA